MRTAISVIGLENWFGGDFAAAVELVRIADRLGIDHFPRRFSAAAVRTMCLSLRKLYEPRRVESLDARGASFRIGEGRR